MRWRSCPYEGWWDSFAWYPTLLDDGTTVWLETYRIYVNRFGYVATRIK